MKKVFKFLNLILILCLSTFTFILSGCKTKLPTPPDPPVIPTTPVENDGKKIYELFSGYSVISRGESIEIFDPITNQNQQFNNLLKRQIDVLAQDILFRLIVVYGKGADRTWLPNTQRNNKELAYELKDTITDNKYKMNNQDAIVSVYNLLKLPDHLTNNDADYLLESGIYASQGRKYSNFNLNDIATYAYEISTGTYTRNLLNDNLYLRNSIAGYYRDSNENVTNDYNIAWNWDYYSANIDAENDSEETVFNKYKNTYLNKLKYAIASILAYGESGILSNNNLEYSESGYNKLINEINHLGFLKYDRQRIQKFILNEVIGEYLVYYDSNNFKPEIEILDQTSELSLTDTNRKYKAYEIIVPALLERAFLNAFGGYETALNSSNEYDNLYVDQHLNNIYTLYPKLSRSYSTELPILELEEVDITNPPSIPMTNYMDIRSIILKPKTDVAVLELWMFLETLPEYEIEFKINVTYKGNGITYLNDIVESSTNKNLDKTLMKVNGLTQWGYDLNIADKIIQSNPAYMNNYPAMGAYNGSVITNYNTYNSPFGVIQNENGIGTQFNAGSNYIELSFIIVNKYKVNGDIKTPTNDNIPFRIGFADPF